MSGSKERAMPETLTRSPTGRGAGSWMSVLKSETPQRASRTLHRVVVHDAVRAE